MTYRADVTFSILLPAMAPGLTAQRWPQTAAEARQFCNERNAEARKRRADEAAKQQRARQALGESIRTAQSLSAPRRPARKPLNAVEIYLNARGGAR